jgi:uncharacterized protein
MTTRMIRLSTAFLSLAALALAAPEPALITAVKRSDARTVKLMIASKSDVNIKATDGSTPLHWAVKGDSLPLVDLLLAAGADAKAANRYKITPMNLAATNGNPVIIERLLKAGVDPNEVSADGQSALMTAALNGRVDALQMLLKNGAKVNAVEPFKGQTAIMWAAGEGNASALDLLIEYGGDIKAKSQGGYTALLLAVLNNQPAVVDILLAHGANIEDKTPDGTTALNLAAVNGFFDLGVKLLDKGANPNAVDGRGSALFTTIWLNKPGTSWEAAALGMDPDPVPRQSGRLSGLQFAEALLKKGANVNAKITWKEMRMSKSLGTTRNPPNINLGRHYLSFVGSTPYYNAARNGDPDMMRLLVKYGADPKIATAVGVTPLMAAACLDYYEGESPGPLTGVPEAQRLEAVKLALELGGDINAKTHFGNYPMIGTTEQTLLTYPDNMNDLLDLGVGDPRWDGMTALHGAIISNQPSIVRYLVEKGADIEAKNRLGWTPMMITKGIFMANSKKEFPVARQILEAALASKQGQSVAAR